MLIAVLAAALASACPQHMAGGAPPAAEAVVETCFTGFAVGYSPAWGEPAWSAEHITAESARAGEATKRNGAFHVCELPDGSRSVPPSAYLHSGEDLGHMTPAGDRGSDKPETFGTCNMVPQQPNLNRKVWAGIEASLRHLAETGADLYVVTGPVVPPDAPRLAGRVAVPSRTWKAVYVVGRGSAAWDCTNDVHPVCSQESVAALEAEIGFDPLPAVAEPLKAIATPLPPPTKGAD